MPVRKSPLQMRFPPCSSLVLCLTFTTPENLGAMSGLDEDFVSYDGGALERIHGRRARFRFI